MEKETLIRKVVEAVGAEESQSNVVFKTFISKLADYLGNGEAIKLEGIGTFQLNKEPIPRLERVHSDHPKIEKMKIFYSPIVNEIPDDIDKLFLSFDVDTKSEDSAEFNEDVFDLGLDKPLIPLDKTVDEIVYEIDSEEIDSITDEKLDHLIEDGEKIDGFELFDKLMGESSTVQTANKDNDDEIEMVEQLIEDGDKDNILESDEEIQDDLMNDEFESEEMEDPFTKLEDLYKKEESEESADENDNEEITDDLEESDDPTEMESETREIPSEENDEAEITDDLEESDDPTEMELETREIPSEENDEEENTDDLKESDDPTEMELETREIPSEENDEEEITDDLEESDESTDTESETWEISSEDNDKGDLIFEEAAEDHDSDDEEITETIEEEFLETDLDEIDETEIEDNKARDPFDELEDYLNKEKLIEDFKDEEKEEEPLNDDDLEEDKALVEPEIEAVLEPEIEAVVEPEIEAVVEPEIESVVEPEIEAVVEPEIKARVEDKKEVKVSYNRKYRRNERGPAIWIFAAIAIVLIILMIIYLPQDEKPTNQTQVIPQSKEDVPLKSTEDGEKKSDELKLIKEKVTKTEKPKDVVNQSAIPKQTGLYRDIQQDRRVTDVIYYNGKNYTVQASSWRTAKIAEGEVNRYRKLGFDAFIYQVFIKSKGETWNRVRIGYFKSRNEAEKFIQSKKL